MQPRDLIVTAKRLVGRHRTGKPRQADLKRALSTAYFAMFHAVCRNCADCFVGKTAANRSLLAWRQAYRAVNHGTAKTQYGKKVVMDNFPIVIQNFASKFIELQNKRHQADYDSINKLRMGDVLTEINAAEVAIKKLQESSIKDKRAFAVWTVMAKK